MCFCKSCHNSSLISRWCHNNTTATLRCWEQKGQTQPRGHLPVTPTSSTSSPRLGVRSQHNHFPHIRSPLFTETAQTSPWVVLAFNQTTEEGKRQQAKEALQACREPWRQVREPWRQVRDPETSPSPQLLPVADFLDYPIYYFGGYTGNLCIFGNYMNAVVLILIALFQKCDIGTLLTKKKKKKLLLWVTSKMDTEKHSGPNLASLCACRSDCLHFGRN